MIFLLDRILFQSVLEVALYCAYLLLVKIVEWLSSPNRIFSTILCLDQWAFSTVVSSNSFVLHLLCHRLRFYSGQVHWWSNRIVNWSEWTFRHGSTLIVSRSTVVERESDERRLDIIKRGHLNSLSTKNLLEQINQTERVQERRQRWRSLCRPEALIWHCTKWQSNDEKNSNPSTSVLRLPSFCQRDLPRFPPRQKKRSEEYDH